MSKPSLGSTFVIEIEWLGLVLLCLTPLSTIFQLYRGGQWWLVLMAWVVVNPTTIRSQPREPLRNRMVFGCYSLNWYKFLTMELYNSVYSTFCFIQGLVHRGFWFIEGSVYTGFCFISLDIQNRISQGYFRVTWTLK